MTRTTLFCRAACFAAFVAGFAPLAAAAERTDPRLAAYLDRCNRNYSEEHQMLGERFSGPGYASTVASGTWVHATRGSLAYAAALLKRNAPGEAERAAKIIRKVISLQDTDPKSRTYSDHLSASAARFLSEQTGVPIRAHSGGGGGAFEALPHLPCPPELKPRFFALPSDPLELRRTFSLGSSPQSSTVGVTWFTAEACLGSINRSTLWTQRRPLLAYWKTAEDPAVVLRLRFLHDGRDFASMGVDCEQHGCRVLSVFHPLRNHGDWHPGLDRPADGAFQAADFRVRYELSGKGVQAAALDNGRFALQAGERRAVVHTLPGRFAGGEVAWQLGRSDDNVFLEGICYHGEKKSFSFRDGPEVVLAAGARSARVS